MEQVSIKNLNELISKPEIEQLINETTNFQKVYYDSYIKQMKLLEHFDSIVQFLVENIEEEIIVFIEKEISVPIPQSNIASPSTDKEIYFVINKSGFRIRDLKNKWSENMRFESFTPIGGSKLKYNSLMNTMFGIPNIYEQVYPKLSEDGKELFSKLKDKFNATTFNQISDKWTNYKIGPLNEDEKKIFEFCTNMASFTFHTRNDGVHIFMGNSWVPKGSPRPTFNKFIFNKDRHDKEKFVFEKMFIINHFDEIKCGVESYKKYELSKINFHLEFIRETNDLITKFVILKQL